MPEFNEGLHVCHVSEAIAALFMDGAIDRMAPNSPDQIRAAFIDLAQAWDFNDLYRGTPDEIQKLVATNLVVLEKEHGFSAFKLDTIRRGSVHAAQVSAVFRGGGTIAIRIWKSTDRLLYVCGSNRFLGMERLLATAPSQERGTSGLCPNCGSITQIEKVIDQFEGHVCPGCDWAAIWCIACRQAPMTARRYPRSGPRCRSDIWLRCDSCRKEQGANKSVSNWLRQHGVAIPVI